MKAKLAFVEGENGGLQEELAQLDAALAGRRDELATLKVSSDRGSCCHDGPDFKGTQCDPFWHPVCCGDAGAMSPPALPQAKRDRLRQQGQQLREGSVFVTSPLLLQDMRVRVGG
jgi:hypothetical protein